MAALRSMRTLYFCPVVSFFYVSFVEEILLLNKSQYIVNFGALTAEIGSGVWGTPANFNGFRVLTTLLHGTLVVGVSQTLRR